MATSERSATDELWRRFGMEELRQALTRLETAIRQLDHVLRALPSCHECARTSLLEDIHALSRRAGTEMITLSTLAETLREAAAAAERSHSQLLTPAPTPCRCLKDPCTCHE